MFLAEPKLSGGTCDQQHEDFLLSYCDEWIKYKSEVFNEGWTLLDEEEFLRHGI